MTKNNFSVLITVGENNLLMFVVHCLSQVKGIKIYIIGRKEFSDIKHSNKISNYTYYPNLNEGVNWVEGIKKEIEKFNIDLIMPIDEYGIRKTIKYRNLIVPLCKVVILPSLESFDIANDKELLWKHMQEHEIPCPKTYLGSEMLNEDIISFPVLIKPIEGGGGKGIFTIKDKEAYRDYFLDNKINYSYLIQSYVTGYDIDCSVLCDKGQVLAYTIQKGTLVGENDFVPKIGVEFLINEELLAIVKKLMLSLNWSGLAHIDMRFDKNDNTFKVIEINPRCWESIEASEIAGVNFPYLHALKSLNFEFDKPKYKQVKYLNLLGLSKTFKNNKWFLFNFRFILNNTPVKYFKKDPLPLLYIIYYKIKSLF